MRSGSTGRERSSMPRWWTRKGGRAGRAQRPRPPRQPFPPPSRRRRGAAGDPARARERKRAAAPAAARRRAARARRTAAAALGRPRLRRRRLARTATRTRDRTTDQPQTAAQHTAPPDTPTVWRGRRRRAKTPDPHGRERWPVERTNAWLHNWRRVSTRWERRAELYLALLQLACSMIICQILERSF